MFNEILLQQSINNSGKLRNVAFRIGRFVLQLTQCRMIYKPETLYASFFILSLSKMKTAHKASADRRMALDQ